MSQYFNDLLTGPGHARFIIQPLVAIFFGIRDGIADAKSGRTPYVYLLLFNKEKRSETFKEGFMQIINIYVVAVILDAVAQYLIFGFSRVQTALITGFTIVFLPYMIARALTNRILHKNNKPGNTESNNES